MISVLILTLNEERALPDCLASVAWADDLVVFDSFSTDRTVAIAQAAGARVVQRTFDNYANQRNASLKEIAFKHPWVLVLDADERVPQALRDELLATVASAPPEIALYRLRRHDLFFGRWLRGSSGYPTWFPRLLRPDQVWVEREINEEVHTHGGVGMLHGHLVHYPFSKGLAHWLERHNRYSSLEAAALLAETRRPMKLLGCFTRDPVVRRRWLKQLAFRLPGRPLLAFAYLYVWRAGFLDGLPGFHYCVLRMIYEHLIDLKVKEAKRQAQGLPV